MEQEELFRRRTQRKQANAPRKSRFQVAVERRDRQMLSGRIERLRWVHKVYPSSYGFLLPGQTAYVFEEARRTFLDGHYISTLILGCAFLEHRFAALLEEAGHERESRVGLKDMIKCLRKNNLVASYLLDKADRIREYRNPFVHLKPMEHPHEIFRRAINADAHPDDILERDAREALALMLQVATGKGLRF